MKQISESPSTPPGSQQAKRGTEGGEGESGEEAPGGAEAGGSLRSFYIFKSFIYFFCFILISSSTGDIREVMSPLQGSLNQ